MTGPSAPISPDGAYWWDGQAWRPMPPQGAPAPAPPVEQAADRPFWLPDSAEAQAPQSAPAAAPPPAAYPPAAYPPSMPVYRPPAAYQPPPAPTPLWETAPTTSAGRNWVVIVAGAAILLMLVVAGGYALTHLGSQNQPIFSIPNPIQAETTALAGTPGSAAAQPLTADLSGQYCPVTHLHDSACWQGSFINTGPAVKKLALIFVTTGGYSDWFANHSNGSVSGVTTAGCEVDAPNSRIVCTSVAPGAQVRIDLEGRLDVAGEFRYAIEFADVSSSPPVYVDRNSDGSHQVVWWTESVT